MHCVRRPLHHILFIGTIAVALTACGGDAASGGSTSDAGTAASPTATTDHGPLPKACELIDAARVQTVLGQPAGLMDDAPENCVWASQGHPGSITMMMVQISEETSVEEAKTLYGITIKAMGGAVDGKDGTLDGIGDEAWHNTGNIDAVGARQIVVRKGHRQLMLNVTGMGQGDSGLDERLQSAARDAAARL